MCTRLGLTRTRLCRARAGLVLVGSGAGTMYGFEAASGKVAWSWQTARVVVGMKGGSGRAPITGSAVVAPDGKLPPGE